MGKYEEALERAKAGKPIDEVFPELKDSEDEKVRKVIESIIRVYGKTQGEWIAGYDMDTLVAHLRDAFAYLEKQKEQKSIEDVIKNITKNKEAATEFLKSAGIMNDNGELAEMYRSEQQPLSTEETELNSIAFLEQLGYTCVPPRAEQKPAEWSEEDKRNLEDAISVIEHLKNDCDWGYVGVGNDIDNVVDFLKSLRPQPKSIISDTDKSNLKDVPAIIRKSNHPFKENIALIIEKYL